MNKFLLLLSLVFFVDSSVYAMHSNSFLSYGRTSEHKPPLHPGAYKHIPPVSPSDFYEFTRKEDDSDLIAFISKGNARLGYPDYAEYLEIVNNHTKGLDEYRAYERCGQKVSDDVKDFFTITWHSKYPGSSVPDFANIARIVDSKLLQMSGPCASFLLYKLEAKQAGKNLRDKTIEEYKAQYRLNQAYMASIFASAEKLSKSV